MKTNDSLSCSSVAVEEVEKKKKKKEPLRPTGNPVEF
jgi:hypothetical protein